MGGGNMSPHFWQWEGPEYLMPPPPFVDGTKIMYFNIYLRFTVIFTGPRLCVKIQLAVSIYFDILDRFRYSDILSIYSIYRIRGNRNQSHNDLHFSKYVYGRGGGGGSCAIPDTPSVFRARSFKIHQTFL